MPSPTLGLLWEIWRRHRQTLAAVLVLTAIGWLVDRQEGGADSSPLVILLAAGAFMLLLAAFNYTESSRGHGLGQFPRRLFALPVTTLRLVTVPVVAGTASIEILYLLWSGPLSRGGSASVWFTALLFAALMVFYLSALWTLERAGSLRLVALGAMALGLFVVGQLPSFPPTPPPAWRSEIVLAGIAGTLAVVAYVLAWRHVDRLRGGGGRDDLRAESLFGAIGDALPARRHAFASPAAAHFWFEWRAAGVVLPSLVAATLLLITLVAQASGDETAFRLQLIALAAPIVLAVPVGIAFSRPAFWTQDVSVPAFVAVLPLRSEDLIATRLAVAAASTALSWIIALVFMAAWMVVSGPGDGLSYLAIQLWAFHEQSLFAVYSIGVLVVLTGMFVTWRLLVVRLWSGLSGTPALVSGSVLTFAVAIVIVIALEADTWPGWLFDDPARFGPLAWSAAAAVILKYWLAAYSWRHVPSGYLRRYALILIAGTLIALAFGLVVWNMVRIYVPLDLERARSVIILAALLSVPLMRIGLATSLLNRNRHRA
jgi:hypothetical protein